MKKVVLYMVSAMAVAVVALVVVGLLVGPDDSPTKSATAAETPTETVTVTVTPDPVVETKTVEVEVEREVTPNACVEALRLADRGFSISGDVMSIVQDAFTAVQNYDVEALNDATDRMADKNAELHSNINPYVDAKSACLASAE